MNQPPYTDDAQPIRSVIKDPRGGKRSGSGRHPKPSLTPEEVAWLLERRPQPGRRATHGSSWEALAPEFNQRFRWGTAVDPRTKQTRGLSASSLKLKFAAETKIRQQSKSAAEPVLQPISNGVGDSGPRMAHGDGNPSAESTQPSENQSQFLNEPPTEAPIAVRNVVESERGGAA